MEIFQIPQKVFILIAGSVLGGIALITVLVWLLRIKVARTPGTLDKVSVEEIPTSSSPKVVDVDSEIEARDNAPTLSEADIKKPSLEELALKIADADLRDCLIEITGRIHNEDPNFGSETSLGFIEEMVDRVDDLAAMTTNQDGQAAAALVSFRETIASILSACGAELIHSADWDPALQRAIAKEVTPGITVPSILRFGSTGFRRHGQLIRKQEVVLAVPESN
jgi:molecular chaperone GrpE (heat shock protein)